LSMPLGSFLLTTPATWELSSKVVGGWGYGTGEGVGRCEMCISSKLWRDGMMGLCADFYLAYFGLDL